MNYPKDREHLRQRWDSGERFHFYFFYGHKKPVSGVDSSCFSQWFEAGFDVDGHRYPTAEHWMMAEKARLFNDEEMLKEILAAPDPKSAKAFGRKVEGFEQDVWNANRVDIVTRGNVAKFEQNPELGEFLQSTGGTILVEAAGRDVIWGIGLGKSNEKAQDPRTWRGRNLLGFVLTEVREVIGLG
ncbi:NADAR family protein [Mariniblastus sp.]|nr:NADAR family protein [Mariniblastus sp.]